MAVRACHRLPQAAEKDIFIQHAACSIHIFSYNFDVLISVRKKSIKKNFTVN